MRPNGQRRDVVVVGGSAGALEPLKVIVAHVPPDLGIAMLVVLHLSPTSSSSLATILNRIGGMHAVTPKDGDPLLPGYLYVGAPDHHLDVSTGVIRNTHRPEVNRFRPSVDVLFRSTAAAFGPRTIAVLLSGGMGDGGEGLAAVRDAGGVTIVQNPDDATVPSMPRHAIELAAPDRVVNADEIGGLIAEIAGGPGSHRDGPGMPFAAGNGNGAAALWAGVRSLEEQAELSGVHAKQARCMRDTAAHDRHVARKELATVNAEALRKLLVDRD